MNTINKYLLFLPFLLAACQGAAPHEEGHEGHTEQEETASHEEGWVELTGQQADAVHIQTDTLRAYPLGAGIKANGQLEVPPQNEARVSAYLGGNVNRILVIEGDKVKKGQTLATLSHPDLIAIQQDYQEALNELSFLEEEYTRKQQLYKEGVSSGRQFQQADADHKTMQSRVAALKAKLHMLHLDPEAVASGKISVSIPVTTPIGGFVKKVKVLTGQYVPPQQELFEIVDNSHIHADLMVFQKDMEKLRQGQKIFFTVGNMLGETFEARIFSIGKVLEEDPRAVHVHAEITGSTEDLIPGMYVQGRIITEETETLALPEDGIAREGDKTFIFLAEQGKKTEGKGERIRRFRMVEVGTGVQEGGLIAIKPAEQLPEDAIVVTSGAYYLLAEMKKGEAGHHH
ncbi:cobalt-zinc-cadmium efflux system membrane fusion protein [Anseongella ginsenosidimutans]|uniref:Cobalt-zinc-cadmium efflux system membrane fusion protein n=1 Tax=Anseongella ginsenosidimutans TaxID=496056 RepID=A0A4R3KPC5_9SPHI|nr:efflux RND transporter periplasmic adaptor subunit [Anseongella ginsenosidimutans]QEC52574.1 efflux RND transporter periplasmic adaptor subunit [Anseongella ginsenosidimutans]TCS86490.1 cobalt-zinc-cadmium efflux system membrane fusion protein [Anseongella ginsenosidimutans]